MIEEKRMIFILNALSTVTADFFIKYIDVSPFDYSTVYKFRVASMAGMPCIKSYFFMN